MPTYQVLKSDNKSLALPDSIRQKNKIKEEDESTSQAHSRISGVKPRKSVISSDLHKSSALSRFYRLKEFKAMGTNYALEGVTEQRF